MCVLKCATGIFDTIDKIGRIDISDRCYMSAECARRALPHEYEGKLIATTYVG